PAVPDTRILNGVRALYVDTHPGNRRVVQSQLQQQGMQIDCEDSGLSVLHAVRQARMQGKAYKLLIMGSQLGDMQALELSKVVKTDHLCAETMLVMLSSSSRPSDAQRFADAGFSAFLGSPAPQHMLLEILTILCNTAGNNIKPPFLTAAALGGGAAEHDDDAPFADFRLLVADDNLVNQRVAAHMLRRLGCKVDFAASGHAVIAMHAEKNYDLIFMDCQMPGLDGYDATAKIRLSESPEQHVPIIALTAHAIQGEREKCLAAGMDDYMSKPIRMHTLREMAGKWLRAGRSPEAIQPPAGQRDEQIGSPSEDLESVRQFFGPSFGELAQLFMSDSSKRLAALHAASDNPQELAGIAHILSGSCASIGAKTLANLCHTLENDAKAGASRHEIDRRLGEIVSEYRKTEFSLQAMLLDSGMSRLEQASSRLDEQAGV
ncbi:MAG: response regulator, partial [Burkholderiaceae bacterium]